jgi:hypothetical protein
LRCAVEGPAVAFALAFAFAFLSVIPEGNLLLLIVCAQTKAVILSGAARLLRCAVEGPAVAFAFLSVIPEGNLLLPIVCA